MLIDPKTLQDYLEIQLQKWKDVLPNANINPDSMIYMDASSIAEVLYLMQSDAITLANNAFIAYATGDELSNLGDDRGIARKIAVASSGYARFGRDTVSSSNWLIAAGTQISTQPSGLNGAVIAYQVTENTYLYGTVNTPGAPTGTQLFSGGLLGPATYRYKITAVSGDGTETDAGAASTTVIASGTTNAISVAWSAVTNAASYNVYLGIGASPSNYYFLINTVAPNFVDTVGSTSSLVTAPVVNSTGTLYTEVPIICTQVGTVGNAAVGTITQFITKPLGIDYVTNATEIYGGVNEEDDDSYRARIRTALRSNTGKVTISGYKQTVESYPGVASASVSIPVGGEFRNEISIIITANTVSGIPSQDLIDAVQAYIMLDENRAPCDNITVSGPVSFAIDYDVTVTERDTLLSIETVQANVRASIDAFFLTVPVGQTLYKSHLEDAIHDTEGVIDFIVNIPATNIYLDPNQVPTGGVSTINVF